MEYIKNSICLKEILKLKHTNYEVALELNQILNWTFETLKKALDSIVDDVYLGQETMKIHHDKHHKAYTDKLNAALEGHADLQGKLAEDLVSDLNSIPEDIRGAVKNHGGGFINHTLFWSILKKDVELSGEIKESLDKFFGSFEKFKEEFTQAAMTQFGSGWAWLVVNVPEKKLQVIKTANQDSPLSQELVPILGLDVWEHAYYLKYQNRRPEYIEAFFNIINWEKVNELYLSAKP